jgi:chorismate mutase
MKKPLLIAGPCSVESKTQIFKTAFRLHEVLKRQDKFDFLFFRAGLWKARSKPNSFKGVGEFAFPWLQEIRKKYGFKLCVEVGHPKHIQLCEQADIDALWIGARTTVNPFQVDEIVRAITQKDKPVFIKNPVIPDLNLWLGAVERFEKEGIKNIFAIHRGFNIGQNYPYRNTPYWQIPIEFSAQRPDIPIINDPSHISGKRRLIPKIAQQALNLSFSGLIFEVHHEPAQALSDKMQQLTPDALLKIIQKLELPLLNTDSTNFILEPYRNRIQDIDNQIMFLFKKRMEIIDEISKVKKQNGFPVLQVKQWEKVEKHYLEFAKKEALDRNFILSFLKILHYSSLQHQQKEMDK